MLDADPATLTRYGSVLVEPHRVTVNGFDAVGASCRDVAALATSWAIGRLASELTATMERPGGGNVGIGNDLGAEETPADAYVVGDEVRLTIAPVAFLAMHDDAREIARVNPDGKVDLCNIEAMRAALENNRGGSAEFCAWLTLVLHAYDMGVAEGQGHAGR